MRYLIQVTAMFAECGTVIDLETLPDIISMALPHTTPNEVINDPDNHTSLERRHQSEWDWTPYPSETDEAIADRIFVEIWRWSAYKEWSIPDIQIRFFHWSSGPDLDEIAEYVGTEHHYQSMVQSHRARLESSRAA